MQNNSNNTDILNITKYAIIFIAVNTVLGVYLTIQMATAGENKRNLQYIRNIFAIAVALTALYIRKIVKLYEESPIEVDTSSIRPLTPNNPYPQAKATIATNNPDQIIEEMPNISWLAKYGKAKTFRNYLNQVGIDAINTIHQGKTVMDYALENNDQAIKDIINEISSNNFIATTKSDVETGNTKKTN